VWLGFVGPVTTYHIGEPLKVFGFLHHPPPPHPVVSSFILLRQTFLGPLKYLLGLPSWHPGARFLVPLGLLWGPPWSFLLPLGPLPGSHRAFFEAPLFNSVFLSSYLYGPIPGLPWGSHLGFFPSLLGPLWRHSLGPHGALFWLPGACFGTPIIVYLYIYVVFIYRLIHSDIKCHALRCLW
jgi:hypothetical protein